MTTEKTTFQPRVPRRFTGTYRPRADALDKTKGRAVFADDMTLKRRFPDMLYAKVLRSPYPHAKIKRIDTSKAAALPGVRAIITYDDPEFAALPMTSASWTDACNSHDFKRSWNINFRDRKVLGDHARWVGDEVGVVVAADSEDIAERALKLVDVDWEVLPFVLTVEDALKPGAPILHPEMNPDSNYLPPDDFYGPDVILDHGDVEKAFAEADVVVETTCKHGDATQAVLDYWSCMAHWEGPRLTMYSNSYGADQTRIHLSEMLNLPLNKVRVISPFVGGQHGRGDTGDQPFFIIAALLSKRTGKPVKYRHNRTQTFHDTRTSILGTCKIGATKTGKITAIEFKFLGDAGAYGDLTMAACKFVPREWAELSLGHIHNIRIEAKAVYTNRIPSSCMRSVGNIQCNWILGQAIDALAEKLGMDPVEVVIQNCGHHLFPVPNPSLEGVLREGAERIGWSRRHAPGQGEWYEGSKKRGIGFSFHNTWHAAWQEYRRGPIQTLIKINHDGTVILQAPTIEVGGGSSSCAVFSCAETLGVKPEDILWMSTVDTDMGLKDQVQTDSAVSHVLPESVYRCALKAKQQLLEVAAPKMEAKPEELDICDGRIFLKANPEMGMTIKEMYSRFELFSEGNLVPITVFEAHQMPPEDDGISYMCVFTEVEVDTETGEVKVLKMVNCTDGGTVMYPPGAEGQLTGGQCIGLGEALYEGMVYDKATAIPLNFNFVDYKVPTMADFPDIEPVPMEIWKGNGEYGACGMGESAPCCTPRAVANAIYNAVGVKITDLPITPIKVLQALGKEGK